MKRSREIKTTGKVKQRTAHPRNWKTTSQKQEKKNTELRHTKENKLDTQTIKQNQAVKEDTNTRPEKNNSTINVGNKKDGGTSAPRHVIFFLPINIKCL